MRVLPLSSETPSSCRSVKTALAPLADFFESASLSIGTETYSGGALLAENEVVLDGFRGRRPTRKSTGSWVQ